MVSALRIIFICGVIIMADSLQLSAQIFCKENGNVIIYSNYDGGYLNINIDEDIPNLKIGITTYEDCEITISGTYVSNVEQVIYAGYQGDNQHCNPSPLTTSVIGVPANIVTILQYPTATWSNGYGYPYIICNYQCDSASYQGGCNTPDQIAHYFLTEFGGLLYYHFTQYGCWSGTYNVSAGGNCCIGEDLVQPQFSITANFSASTDTLCPKEGVFFQNSSVNTYPGAPQYEWDFGDGSPVDTSMNVSHAYSAPGSYTVTLTVTDSSGVAFDTETMVITVLDCLPTGIEEVNYDDALHLYPNPAHSELVCSFPEGLGLPALLELIDATGRSHILKQISSAPEGSRKIRLDVTKTPAGWYLLRISGSNYAIHEKIFIE